MVAIIYCKELMVVSYVLGFYISLSGVSFTVKLSEHNIDKADLHKIVGFYLYFNNYRTLKLTVRKSFTKIIVEYNMLQVYKL